jgi:hypothetical protein
MMRNRRQHRDHLPATIQYYESGLAPTSLQEGMRRKAGVIALRKDRFRVTTVTVRLANPESNA